VAVEPVAVVEAEVVALLVLLEVVMVKVVMAAFMAAALDMELTIAVRVMVALAHFASSGPDVLVHFPLQEQQMSNNYESLH